MNIDSTIPLLSRLPAPPRKIAVVRASRLGDFICAGPALRSLRAAVPRAEIALITLPMLHDLALRLPHIDRVIAFPGFPGIAQQFFRARETLAFLQRMQEERFDVAIQMQGSGVYANPFTLLLGAGATAGFVRAEDDASCLDAALLWPERGHEVNRLLALMQCIGAKPLDDRLEFPLTAEDREAGANLVLSLPRPLIGIHCGSHDPRRRWPRERFAAVARTLLHRHGGSAIALGSPHESETTAALARAIGTAARNLAGCTSFATLGGVIAQLDLLLANDSGPAHIAYALGAPTVTVFRRGGSERYGPLRRGPYAAVEADTDETLAGVAEVSAAALELLALPSASREDPQSWIPRESPQSAR